MIQTSIYIHVILAILLVGCSTTDIQKTNTIKSTIETTATKKNREKKLPQTVKEAVAQILNKMSEKDKETIKNTKKDDLIMYHHGWGTGIRNSFGLWGNNHALLKDTGKNAPDDASMVIIEAVWKRLQETK